jgi:hypothetical protein
VLALVPLEPPLVVVPPLSWEPPLVVPEDIPAVVRPDDPVLSTFSLLSEAEQAARTEPSVRLLRISDRVGWSRSELVVIVGPFLLMPVVRVLAAQR